MTTFINQTNENAVLQVKREGEFSYLLHIEENFTKLTDELKKIQPADVKLCIIADTNTSELYLPLVQKLLNTQYTHVDSFVIQAGEEYKTLTTVQDIYRWLVQHNYERSDMLVALGGGVVGDITGYAAATYLRGIDFIQVPTTLLSQVDSSIGGKTGVDFESYKNMVGAFHQPRLVYINIDTLRTLDAVQFTSGMAEIIKAGLIRDKLFYQWIQNNCEKIRALDSHTLKKLIYKSCQIKRDVVESDPTEKGLRAILNFGHTVGHAIEKETQFTIPHGQCVGIGYIAAAYLSYKKKFLTLTEVDNIKQTNTLFGIPNHINQLNAEEVFENTRKDKKMRAGKIQFILLDEIGNAIISKRITEAELLECIQYVIGEEDEG
ncbi:MAG: 3-dehydroquinate synthase [Lachnospiraceae bacterium]